MKAWSLLALRLGTGLLLVLWGALRLVSPAAGPGLADKYYSGLMNIQSLQIAFGAAEVIVGLLVAMGLFRRFAYPAQAAILIAGAAMLWKYLLDPMGMYLLDRETSQILFFPSITVAAATLALIAFRDDDRLALDRMLDAKRAAPR